MVEKLVDSLVMFCPEVTEIFVTKNIREPLAIPSSDRVVIIENLVPKGFGANHNAAFRLSKQPYFCSLNPDIGLLDNPFPELISAMNQAGAGVVAPVIKTPQGDIDDSARYFPTICSLARKILFGADGRFPANQAQASYNPEWVAGMFMLFQRPVFSSLEGFDESFFLYYEDVDICARVWKQGVAVTVCSRSSVVHDARRSSRRNLKYLSWHLKSMARYFWKHWGRLPRVR